MTLSNLATVVDHLGVPFTSLIARRDLLSFSINQLNILKDISRKISKIDPLDSNYPNNQILVKFIKNGSRVLEESLSLMNKNHSTSNLPQINEFLKEKGTQIYRNNGEINKSNDFIRHTSKDKATKLEILLNDTLFSFVNILGNSGYFFDNLDFLKNILNEITVKGLNYSGLVCMVGIVNKCDLFRIQEFNDFSKSIFSYFSRNWKILKYLNDLDTTLLLFHKIAMLYMTQADSITNRSFKTGNNTISSDISDLLMLLDISIDKVYEILSYTNNTSVDQSNKMSIKSVHNLIQSVFLIYFYNKNLLFDLNLDKLNKINQILLENSEDINLSCESSKLTKQFQQTKLTKTTQSTQLTQPIDKHNKFIYNKHSIHINNTSSLHTKIAQTLSTVLDSTHHSRACSMSERVPSTAGSDTLSVTNNTDHTSSVKDKDRSKNNKEIKEIDVMEQRKPKILNEVRIGSSMYFIDMLIN